MTLEKWLDKINDTVREFVQSIDCEYDCRHGQNFEACLDENVIEWSILVVEKGEDAFCKNFISRFPNADKLNYFTLALLHEIGHFETEWEMVDDIDERNTITDYDEYFNLFNERIATDWAGEWIDENLELALTVDKMFLDLLNDFYNEMLD